MKKQITIEQVKEFLAEQDAHTVTTICKEVLQPKGLIIESWSYEDVIWQGQQQGVHLTDEQAKEILSIVDGQHDASIGINWDNISCHIDMYDGEMEAYDPEKHGERELWD